MPETLALVTVAPPTVVLPELVLRVPTLPPPRPATPLVIAAVPTLPLLMVNTPLLLAVPTLPPLTLSVPLLLTRPTLPPLRLSRLVPSTVAEVTLPAPRLSPPPLLIAATPTLVWALPSPTMPPPMINEGVTSAPPAPPSSFRAPPALTVTPIEVSEPPLVSVRDAVSELVP